MDTSDWLFALRKDPIPAIKVRVDALLKDDLVITAGIIETEILVVMRSVNAPGNGSLPGRRKG
jgi:hypothetical protein